MYRPSEYCLVTNNNLTLHPKDKLACHLKAGIYQNELYQFSGDPNIYICTSECELIHIILQYLHCSIEFVRSNSDFGGQKINGTWVGILALFAEKKVDFIPHTFSYRKSRQEIVYYDFMITNPLRILDMFSIDIWLWLLFSYIVCTQMHIFNHPDGGYRSWPRTLAAYVDMFGVTLGLDCGRLKGRQSLLFNPIYVYIWAILILRQIFSGDMTAILLSDDSFKFDHFQQLATTNVQLLVQQNSTTHFYFEKRYPKLISRTTGLPYIEMSSVESLLKIINSNYVMITDRVYAHQIMSTYSHINWHLSQEGFEPTYHNYAMRRELDPQKVKILSRLFRYVHYFGLLEKIQRKLQVNQFRLDHSLFPNLSIEQLIKFRIESNVRHQIQEEHQQNPTNLAAAMFIFTFGVIISFLCFIIELVIFFKFHHRQ